MKLIDGRDVYKLCATLRRHGARCDGALTPQLFKISSSDTTELVAKGSSFGSADARGFAFYDAGMQRVRRFGEAGMFPSVVKNFKKSGMHFSGSFSLISSSETSIFVDFSYS